jgi:Tol biopolymer transport system component
VVPPVYLVGLDGSPPRRILEHVLSKFTSVGRISWHPDGQRVSFPAGGGFWTVSLAGGGAVRAEVSETVSRTLKEADVGLITHRWGPRGDALYFEGASKNVVNLWRIAVDPKTLRWISGPERLTTGLGIDSEVAPSPDGRKLAFVTRADTTRLWSLPFDAKARRVMGIGQPLTSPAVEVLGFDLSADSRWLVFVVRRPGRDPQELWSRSLETGRETMLGDALQYFAPRLSRDGSLVAYRLIRQMDRPVRILAWMALAGGTEHVLPEGIYNSYDWSADGTWILHNCPPPEKGAALCSSPRDARTTSDTRTIAADPEYSLWQGRFSPDGRWVLFNAQSRKNPSVSILGVVPSSGGKWRALTDSRLWADKARWAPDGRTIYFISNRNSAFFDVWGLSFDPDNGQPIGEEFRVTRHDIAGLRTGAFSGSELAVSATRLVVPIDESKGSVWLLDNISR